MKPTYLYVKEPAITGLRYFGKTTRKDVQSYVGSGSYWTNHLKVHAKEHKKNLSKSRTGLLLGRKMSEETKRKMSESQLRRRKAA